MITATAERRSRRRPAAAGATNGTATSAFLGADLTPKSVPGAAYGLPTFAFYLVAALKLAMSAAIVALR